MLSINGLFFMQVAEKIKPERKPNELFSDYLIRRRYENKKRLGAAPRINYMNETPHSANIQDVERERDYIRRMQESLNESEYRTLPAYTIRRD